MNMSTLVTIISIVFAIAATVLAYIFIVPESKKLPGFFRVVRDIFNFKFLVIEKVMQALYICSTLFTILYGFFGIFFFGYETVEYVYSGSIWSSGSYVTKWVWTGWIGFIILILGPIILRLCYEVIMMALLLVKNVIQINNKMGSENADATDKTFGIPSFSANKAPTQVPPMNAYANEPQMNGYQGNFQNAPAYQAPVCQRCGAPLDPYGKCPNCNK